MSLDTPFSVRISPGDDATHLALAGRVDRDAEVELLAAWEAAVATGSRRVVLDLTETSYINSSGLAAIVALLADARGRDVTVAAHGLTPHYRHLFEITRLTDLVEVPPEPGGVA